MTTSLSRFTQLHVHSCYSLLEGLVEPARLVEEAARQNLPAIGLTDHASLAGTVEFYQGCQAAGIHPVFGIEVDLSLPANLPSAHAAIREGPLVLLAADTIGWSNLCRLTAFLLDRPEETVPDRITLEKLGQFSDGTICLSGGRRSLLSQFARLGDMEMVSSLLYAIREIFPNRFYTELQHQSSTDEAVNRILVENSRRAQIPLVASQDIYYLDPGQEELQLTLTSIRYNRPLKEIKLGSFHAPAGYFPSQSEMIQHFSELPEALDNTLEIAFRCQPEMPFGKSHFPQVALPTGVSAIYALKHKAQQGALKLYGEMTPEIQARLDRELSVIASLGFEPIFLIMEEILQFARESGVPFSSRGSAASSLVAHCLGITTPDPLALNLYFERFLNPARMTPPDIDTDICSRRRDEVIQHVIDTYGKDHVAMVGTINRFRPRSALSDVAKAHGLSPAEIRELSASLPRYYYYLRQEEDEETIPLSPYSELESLFPALRYRKIFQQAQAILGLPRHLSVHAGGVVITSGPLTDLLPVQRANKGVLITQIDHKGLEPLGIVKLDLLGIRGLTVLGDVANSIRSWRQSEYSSSLDVLEDIPLDDPQTAERIQNGDTIGCFQIESPGMRATLKEIHAKSIQDVMIALALYRPGPLTGGLKETFVKRHNGQEDVIHLHPALTSLLSDTYGVILYQEQVLRIAHELAGFSLSESDLLRRAMSHFDPGKQMQALKMKFIDGANTISKMDVETAQRVWELMAAFAGYGFPKAHAASYALIGWRSAWCKTHYPAEFMAAVLANWGGYYSQQQYLSEARRMGLPVHPPHLNHSGREFSVAYPDGEPILYMGLDQVRSLTRSTQEKIIHARPFRSLEDFQARVNPRQEEISNLIRCGALEGMGTIPALLKKMQSGPQGMAGQLSLFAEPEIITEEPDWTLAEKVKAQEEILGIGVEAHPLELVSIPAKALTTAEVADRVGKRVQVAAIQQSSHRSRTAGGKTMLFLTVEDLDGLLDVVIFSDVYARYRVFLGQNAPLLIEGIIEQDASRENLILKADKISRLG